MLDDRVARAVRRRGCRGGAPAGKSARTPTTDRDARPSACPMCATTAAGGGALVLHDVTELPIPEGRGLGQGVADILHTRSLQRADDVLVPALVDEIENRLVGEHGDQQRRGEGARSPRRWRSLCRRRMSFRNCSTAGGAFVSRCSASPARESAVLSFRELRDRVPGASPARWPSVRSSCYRDGCPVKSW